MGKHQHIDLGYRPRDQFIPFHMRKERWACLVIHRRAGKTVATVMDLIDAALRCTKPNPRFAYLAPLYVQAKDVAFGYLKMFSARVPGAQINESELRVDFPHNGARVRLYGADNYDRMRGLYFDGIVLDEFADMDPRAWPEVVRPALSDRKGWATFIGTPKGRNAFFDLFGMAEQSDDWFALRLPASVSKLVDEAELIDAQRMMTPEQYAQEYEVDWNAAIMGAYYGREMADADKQGRLTSVEYEPTLPVHLVADLGIDDPSAWIAFQVAHDGVRVLRSYENNGQALAHYVSEIQTWGYKIGDCWLPHDAKVKSLNDGKTRVETLRKLAPGWNFRLVGDHKVIDGINALRLLLPRMWIDAEACKPMIEAWRQYRADYDEKLRVFKKQPLHNWASHYADAGRYLAMAWREMNPVKSDAPKRSADDRLVFEALPDGSFNASHTIEQIIAARKRSRQSKSL